MQVLALGNYLTSRRVRSIGLPSELLDKFLFLWTGKYSGDDLQSILDDSVITVTNKDWTGRFIPDGSSATFAVPDNATYLVADGTDDFWFDGADSPQEITHAELIVSTTMRTFVKYNDVSPFDVSAIGILKAGEVITESDEDILSKYFRLSAQYFGIDFNFNGYFKDNRDWIFPE